MTGFWVTVPKEVTERTLGIGGMAWAFDLEANVVKMATRARVAIERFAQVK
jgi:hypothetical protein